MRVLCQYVCLAPQNYARRTVVEWNEGLVQSLIALDDAAQPETSHTLCFDGIVSGALLTSLPSFTEPADALDLIAACTQAIVVGQPNDLLLWQNVDLPSRRLTQNTVARPLRTLR